MGRRLMVVLLLHPILTKNDCQTWSAPLLWGHVHALLIFVASADALIKGT